MESLLLLGASGSIGRQTIDVVNQEKKIKIVGVSLKSHTEVLNEELNELPYLKWIAIHDEIKGAAFKKEHPDYVYYLGKDCNKKLIEEAVFDKAVNALVGEEGFLPSLLILQKNKTLLLANKESLVIGGELIKKEIRAGHGRLFPIDSEHVALMKLLNKVDKDEIKRMIITASGGSLRDYKKEDLEKVTIREVLSHPTWQMGKRITVDSATMVNKGYEFIEASYLYDWDINNISVWINNESQIHSALELKDNSYFFEVGPSDMRVPISYALNEGKRVGMDYKSVDYDEDRSLSFRKFDKERYPLFSLVLDTYKKGGTAMAFLNAVDEEAVKAFINGQVSYPEMIELITLTVRNDLKAAPINKPEDILIADSLGRNSFFQRLKDYK